MAVVVWALGVLCGLAWAGRGEELGPEVMAQMAQPCYGVHPHVFSSVQSVRRALKQHGQPGPTAALTSVVTELLAALDDYEARRARAKTTRPFYVLEGMDGVGKSTATRGLAAAGIRSVATPTMPWAQHRALFDAQAEPLRRAFYFATNYLAVADETLMEDDDPGLKSDVVVLERLVGSTVAYATAATAGARGPAMLPRPEAPEWRWPADLPRPAGFIWLTVDPQVQLARLQDRAAALTPGETSTNADEEAKLLDAADPYQATLQEAYARFWAANSNLPRLDLDTGTLSPDQIQSQVAAFCRHPPSS
ncbi:uncharacterized protein MONBRDRAFT_8333 [Monosiga brevicollis MX1]|uniref:Thymidylate kinase-like domain-containing protein n=1 Tax=Monosiga brevicollis TaxID=81824 RepID=A9UZR8_MONBE|nr:uncharacterized protein MONBRDRAFT_8333 [Monosiga brevicollis MX1]EDQ89278.1 predicted protein [Monosiga brevicollis MX1]|eukprot:XP_001745854.1 hypothetical protein [Monosiga brevicollis MX1]